LGLGNLDLIFQMSSFTKTTCVDHSLEQLMPIISVGDSGNYVVTLPGFLKAEQRELEQMLNRLFANRMNTRANLALAQQLSLNWCASKAKKSGLTENCLCQ